MVDREKVVAVLRRRFPGAALADIAAAANAIVGLGDEWQEVEDLEGWLGPKAATVICGDPTCLVERLRHRVDVKLLQRVSD